MHSDLSLLSADPWGLEPKFKISIRTDCVGLDLGLIVSFGEYLTILERIEFTAIFSFGSSCKISRRDNVIPPRGGEASCFT